MILDLPELLAPARIVSGRTSMLRSGPIDLNPATVIEVNTCSGTTRPWSFAPRDFAMPVPPPDAPASGIVTCGADVAPPSPPRKDVAADQQRPFGGLRGARLPLVSFGTRAKMSRTGRARPGSTS